jgi:hypothetical protein
MTNFVVIFFDISSVISPFGRDDKNALTNFDKDPQTQKTSENPLNPHNPWAKKK